MMKRSGLFLAAICTLNNIPASASSLLIDTASLKNATFSCRNAPQHYSASERQYVDKLWADTLIFLEGFADTLTSPDKVGSCRFSGDAITETNTPALTGPKRQCITEYQDVQDMLKEIYTVLNNKDEAFKCFTPQIGINGLYSPGGMMTQNSSVATWLNRKTLRDYFHNQKDPATRKDGMVFSDNLNEMLTGQGIKNPAGIQHDITAKGLPELWASVGWVPMYSHDSERNINAGAHSFRSGYAYAEVMGHWGLLQIDKINGEPVGAEIGMTVQRMGTFYPYHFHNIPEIYYTLRQPACLNSIKQFIVGQNNKVLTPAEVAEKTTILRFSGEHVKNLDHYWMSTTPESDPLIYIPRNSLHAFDLKDQCEPDPDRDAHVTLWARTKAHDQNDYGNTNVCVLTDKSLPKDQINKREANVSCEQNKLILGY